MVKKKPPLAEVLDQVRETAGKTRNCCRRHTEYTLLQMQLHQKAEQLHGTIHKRLQKPTAGPELKTRKK